MDIFEHLVRYLVWWSSTVTDRPPVLHELHLHNVFHFWGSSKTHRVRSNGKYFETEKPEKPEKKKQPFETSIQSSFLLFPYTYQYNFVNLIQFLFLVTNIAWEMYICTIEYFLFQHIFPKILLWDFWIDALLIVHFQSYFKDSWNTFDFVTVLGSIVDALMVEFAVSIFNY